MKILTKTKQRKTMNPQTTKILPSDACPKCGTMMREQKNKLPFDVNGEEIVVPNTSHLACHKCGEIVLRLDEARYLRETALAKYRQKYGLLSADEIKSIRERLDLTQGELAKLLHLGSNTISRWESGRNVQAASMDIFLRLIRDLPETIKYLQTHAA